LHFFFFKFLDKTKKMMELFLFGEGLAFDG